MPGGGTITLGGGVGELGGGTILVIGYSFLFISLGRVDSQTVSDPGAIPARVRTPGGTENASS